jgi:hypothetical protein
LSHFKQEEIELNIWEVLEDALIDTVKLVPFLLITYLLMEYLEHHTAGKARKLVVKAGRSGPLWGAVTGLLPQCGFSTAAANLYAAKLISRGTLISVFLATSDEMLPVLLSEAAGIGQIGKLLALKWLIGMSAGFAVDGIHHLLHRKEGEEKPCIHELWEQEHCDCESGVFQSALRHTVHIGMFLLLAAIVLNLVVEGIGEDTLVTLIQSQRILSVVLTAAVGLIPNCAPSVLITHLYLAGTLGLGAAMAGLLVNAGVGMLVLFRMNDHVKDNIAIVAIVYGIGVLSGLILTIFMS